MTTHTPGPWDCWDGRILVDGDCHITGIAIAEVSLDEKHKKQYEHNCFLIAAAPDLLNALKQIEETTQFWNLYPEDHPYGKARAAIAKATGKSE